MLLGVPQLGEIVILLLAVLAVRALSNLFDS